MTWSGAISALETHLATTGMTVRAGEALPARKTSAWYYTGTGDNPLIAETLTDHPYGDDIEVRLYWPVATRNEIPSATLEHEVRNTVRALIALLEADRDLGGNVTDLTIGDVTAGWLDLDSGAWRIATIPLSLGATDTEPISR